MITRISIVASLALAAAASSAMGQTACLQLRIVPQSGTFPAAIDSGTPGGTVAILASDVGAMRTRRFEIQARVVDNSFFDTITPDSLTSATLKISAAVSGSVPGASVAFAQLSVVEVGGSEFAASPVCEPPASDATGSAAAGVVGLHNRWRGGVPSNGSISGIEITNIIPISLAAGNDDDAACAPATRWVPLYSFTFTAPNTSAIGSVTFSVAAIADAATGNTFGYFRNGAPVPLSSNCSSPGTITVQVNPALSVTSDINRDGLITVQDIFNFLTLWFAGI